MGHSPEGNWVDRAWCGWKLKAGTGEIKEENISR